MIRSGALALAALFAAAGTALHQPPPLPMLPSVARARVEVAHDHVVTIEDVDLPRSGWRFGDLDLFVAFGAPGAPLALDARLLAVADGALEPGETEAGERVPFEQVTHRPATARELLGRSQMAGVVIHVPDASFRRAVARGGMAVLRLRSLLALPDEDARTGREVVLRLGAWQGTPLTLGKVQVASVDASVRLSGAAAHLCGPEADPWPLTVSVSPPVWPAPAPPSPAPIAPVLAVRNGTDDLCVRFWQQP
jgi:hypothetical protein